VTAIQSDQVSEFLRGDGRVTYYFHQKYHALAGLYTYAITRGYAAANPLPLTIPKNPPALVPYNYSRAEIRRLLDSASQYR
jgi:hypothetical protein